MTDFQIVRWLSSDDTAAVYEAATAGGRPLIYTVGHNAPEPADEFLTWAETLKSIRHPHVVEVLSAGLTDTGQPFLLCGTGELTLAERLTTSPPDVGEVTRMAAALADGLATVHAKGLRHGTVCPSTVLFTSTGAPMLTGFDMCAPGITKTARPGLYGVPEDHPGAAADVYALAATTYVALGGTLPYVSDPHDASLRHRGITELPGVPVELTGTLRTALNPDPTQRPGAALLRDALSSVEVESKVATGALPKMVVGADVRAVNRGVASINEAATGELPVVRNVPPPPARPPMPPRAPAPAQAAPTVPRKSGRKTTAVALTVVLVAAMLGGAWFLKDALADDGNGDGGNGSGENDAGVSGIEDYDFDSVEFTFPYDNTRTVTLDNGVWAGEDGSGQRFTWEINGVPSYEDVDADGDLDAALVMDRVGTSDLSQYVVVWTWADGTVHQVEQVVSGLCEVTRVSAVDGAFEVVATSTNPYSLCFTSPDEEPEAESFLIAFTGGYLTQVSPLLGSTARCTPMSDQDTVSAPEGARLMTAPHDDAEPLDLQGQVYIDVFDPNFADEVDWVVARVGYEDGSVACGWTSPV